MKTQTIGTPRNWKELKPHPLSELTEFGAGIDVDAMAEHIKQFGYDVDESIVLYEGQILDGRHRLPACVKAGVTPSFKKFLGDNPQAYVCKKVLRQHLNTSQRAMLASSLAQLKFGSNQYGKEGGENSPPSQSDAAEMLNVSRDSVKQARKVQEQGVAELQEAVKDGTVSVSDAAKVADKPAEVQAAAVRKVRNKKTKTAAAAANGVHEAREPGDDTESEKDVGPILDACGHEVPDKCADAFMNLDKFKEMDSCCRQLQKLLDEASKLPGGEQLAMCLSPTGAEGKTVNKSVHLNNLKRDIKATRPHSVCPICQGKAYKNCKGCSGNGWVAKTTWDSMEESIQAKLEVK